MNAILPRRGSRATAYAHPRIGGEELASPLAPGRRSAIGVDRHGNLIYAAGNDQMVRSLAAALQHAGAIRAMELDINSCWVSFITYRASGARGPANLLPEMNRSAFRYLEPDDRDFFTVYDR